MTVFGKIGLQSVDANTATAIRSVIMAVFLILCRCIPGDTEGSPGNSGRQKGDIIYRPEQHRRCDVVVVLLPGTFKFGNVSQVAPIDKLSVVIATIIAVALLGEKISALGGVGVALIAWGALLVAPGQGKLITR